MVDIAACKNLLRNPLFWILILGFAFRVYDLDAPFSGHHSWKEIQTVGMAYRQVTEGGLFETRNLQGRSATMPLPLHVWFIDAMWVVFGMSAWAARLPLLFFGVASIYLMYLVGKEIGGEKIGIYSALFLALSPLDIFFSRIASQLSLVTFFMLLSVLYFWRWNKEEKKAHLYFAGAALAVAGVIMFTPLFLLFSFGAYVFLKKREKIKEAIPVGILAVLPTLIWMLFIRTYPGSMSLLIFNSSEIFRMILAVLSRGGWLISGTNSIVFLLAIPYLVKRNEDWAFFIKLWLLGGVIYLISTIYRGIGNNYYVLPLIPPLCIAAASFFEGIGRKKILLLLVFLAALPMTYVLYDIYYPYDQAGEYLSDMVAENEVIAFTESPTPCFYARTLCIYTPGLVELHYLEMEDIEGLREYAGNFYPEIRGKPYNYLVVPSTFEKTRLDDDLRDHLEQFYTVEKVVSAEPNINQEENYITIYRRK